ncbi:uncharacterized protein PG998_009598 [Apiospora kogelbergensis]|uniref:Iron-sulfur assembly protein 1 n=1 Tax=Apiospora kogelbergensis TaxID=1337665 RepID=A0AAW0R8A8_9PEZI
MNAPRMVLERRTASLLFSRPATTPSAFRPCQHMLRQFAQTSYRSTSEKLETATTPRAYQPYPLSRPPPQPRSNDIPDTSIAGPAPQAPEARSPQSSASKSSPTTTTTSPSSTVSEKEAQKAKPVGPPERKRKLRPRKAAMKLTPTAVEHLRNLVEGPEPKLIRVGVRNRGCSGLAYHLEYVDKPAAFDEEVEQDGVKVLIDSKALFSIIGSEMDWVEDKLNERFVFRNPNIKEECGCGESFMV